MNRRLKFGLILGNLAILLLGVIVYVEQSLNVLNLPLNGYHMQQNMSRQPDERIVVIGIDDMSLEAIGRFPWDRKVYAQLLDIVNKPGHEPSSINFDISFDEASDSASDQVLLEALKKYDNIVFPIVGIMENVTRSVLVEKGNYIPAYGFRTPYEPFAEVVRTAHINANIDSDNVIRKTWLKIQGPDGTLHPSLALNAAEMTGIDVSKYLDQDWVAGDSAKGEILIDYVSTSDGFITIPFISVLNGEIDPIIFQDASVFVGFNAVGFENDNGSTPVEKESKLVYVHANILNQLMNGTVTTTSDWVESLGLMVLLFALIWWLAWRLKTTQSIAVFLGLIAVAFIAQTIIYQQTNHYLDIMNPLLVMLLTYILNIAIKSYVENKQKNFITKQFGRYISPELVKQIATNNTEIQLGGINKVLSILFLDIRGFTPLTERMKPEEVVDFLNEMFNLITTKALENHGTIDKFIGDAAMILFNAPLDLDNHPYYAVKTGWDIQQGMNEVRERIQARHGVTVNCGIGINTGEVVVGNIGSYLRVDYTCIGDNVNTAARIESQSAAGQTLVSEATYELTKHLFEYNFVGERMMKGKSVGIKLFEVVGLKEKEAVSPTGVMETSTTS